MKRTAVVLWIAYLCVWLSACSRGSDLSLEEDVPNRGAVTVQLGEEEIPLRELFVWGYAYDEDADSFYSIDAGRLPSILQEEGAALPTVMWDESFALKIPDDLELVRIHVLTSDYQDMEFSYEGDFSELPRDVYYVAVEVNHQGRYIESKGEYEAEGFQYVFCLDKRTEDGRGNM